MSRSPTGTAKLEKIVGIKFKNTALLEEALTHKSFAMEKGGRIAFNERLEFLGDSVLSSAVAHYLFERYPDVDEGRLSQQELQPFVKGNSSAFFHRERFMGE